MTIALVGQAINSDAATSQTTHVVTLTMAAGNFAALLIATRDNVTATSVVGSVNGAYTQAGAAQQDTNDGSWAEIWYKENVAAGAETVTVTYNLAGRSFLNLSEWSGVKISAALDKNNGANNSTAVTTHPHGSITTIAASVILTASNQGAISTETPAAGFTALTNNAARDYYQYKISSGIETNDGAYTITVATVSAGKIANFLEAAGGAPSMMGQAVF